MKRFTYLLLSLLFTCSFALAQTNGCPGNLLTGSNGYYGGFEAGNNNFTPNAGTDYSYGLPRNGGYEIVRYPRNAGGGGYLSLAPKSGEFQMVSHTRSSSNNRIWYKTISVVPGETYKFCAWIASVKQDPVNGFIINLTVNGTVIASGRAVYQWSEVCGTYTVPNGVTSIEFAITDPNAHGGPSHFLSLDDICLTKTQSNLNNLGNLVWNDTDADGWRDSNEPGIGGVTVKLYTDNNSDNTPDGSAIATVETNAQGLYNFTNLPDGRYIVEIPILYGYNVSNPGPDAQNPDNNVDNDNNALRENIVGNFVRSNAITLTAGQEPTNDGDGSNGNLTLDMGLCGNAWIGDFVWNDQNGNGIQDAGEPGINGVIVTLTYDNGTTTTETTHPYNGIDGYYDFPRLGPGTYVISFSTPTGYSPSPANVGSNDAIDSDPVNGSASVTLEANVSNFTIDAGFKPATLTKLTLGNQVWNDTNQNGVRDAGEPGIGGVTVRLYADANSDQNPDGAAIATTVTSSNGTYYFTNLDAGNYIVGVVVPTNYTNIAYNTSSPNNDIDNDNNGARTVSGEVRTNFITLSVNGEPTNDGDDANSNATLDVGLKFNGGGDGEICIANTSKPNVVNGKITWTINPSNNTVTIRTTLAKTFVDNTYGTNAIGWPGNNHKFSHLVTSDMLQLALYDNANVKRLEFKMDYFSASAAVPSGYQTSGVTGNDGAMLVGSSSHILSVRTSLSENFNTYGYVLTENSPKTDAAYTPNPAYPNWIYDVWYEVTVSLDAFGTSGFKKPSITDLHASPSKTGNDTEIVTEVPCPTGGLVLGNFVWNDTDGDGRKDANEPGIGGIRVSLYTDNNRDNLPDGPAIRNTTTNSQGYYSFSNLPEGRYIASIPILDGYQPGGRRETSASPDNDIDDDNNAIHRVGDELYTNAITLMFNQEPTQDASGYNTNNTFDLALCGNAYIGDLVWNDLNGNGLQDANEPGIAGAEVQITYEEGTVKSVFTDQMGIYYFANLGPGTYTVRFITPNGFTPSPSNVGSDETIDSDPVAGTVTVTLVANVSNMNVDAGFYVPSGTGGTIGDLVWNDVNSNGLKDSGEPGIEGITVKLYEDQNADNMPDGAAIQTTTTNASGIYTFNNLPAGYYVVGIVMPSGYEQGTTTATSSNPNNDTDNDNNGVNTSGSEIRTNYVAISTGESNLTVDFALKVKASAGDCPNNLATNATGYYGGFEAGTNNISPTTGASDLLYGLGRNGSYEIGRSVDEFGGGGYRDVSPRSGNYLMGVHTSNRLNQRLWYTRINVTPGNTYNFCAYTTLLKHSGDGARFMVGIFANGQQLATARVTDDWTAICGSYTVPAGVTSVEFSIQDIKKGLFFLALDDICITNGGGTGGRIGDFVWNDVNGNGIQDAGERGLADVVVRLTMPDNTVRTTITDANGYYQFSNLPAGTFTLNFVTPEGYIASPALQGADRTKDSDPVNGVVTLTLGTNEINNSIDAGFFIQRCPPQPSSSCGAGYLVRKTNHIVNGNFTYAVSSPAPGNTYTGTVNTVPGTEYLAANYSFRSQADYRGTGYPDQLSGNQNAFSITGTVDAFTGPGGVNQLPFPGDPANGVGATNKFLYWNGNEFASQLSLVWEQRATGLVIGKRYTFRFYVSNTVEPLNAGTNPQLLFQTGGTPGLADGSTKWGPIEITKESTANNMPLNGWVRYEYSFTATTTSETFKIFDYAPGGAGDEMAITAIGLDVCEKDTDGDCIPDVDDIDDDNDGITDLDESGGYDPHHDCDGDGIMNYMDETPGCPGLTFSDCPTVDYPSGDGINDFFDWDKDGYINSLDLDSDNDGVLDVQETRDPKVVDLNNDGMVDGVDADGDGLLSTADANDNEVGGPGLTQQDMDRDGHPNTRDLDSDGDGITDLTEAVGGFRSNGVLAGHDLDDDGVKSEFDTYNGFGAGGITPMDTDKDSYANLYDIDSDDDGITDNVEGQPTCSYKVPGGVDTDGDGIDDVYDTNISTCPRRGSGITPFDKDGDGTPDIYDLDTDNDSAPDINEGSGRTGDFVGNYNDEDKDGLIDQFDVFNLISASSNIINNVVHSEMGPNGNFHGPIPAGSNATLPKKVVEDCSNGGDRDWRNIIILPVTLLEFKGNLNTGTVKLNWRVTNESNVDHYKVERSTDGVSFNKVGEVTATGNTPGIFNYGFDDNVSNISNGNLFYRLRQVDKNGAGKLSTTITFKLNRKAEVALAINPNPAVDYFVMKLTSLRDGMATVRVMDLAGKVVLVQNQKVTSGTNAISFNNLSSMASGSYTVQVLLNGETFHEKLIITR